MKTNPNFPRWIAPRPVACVARIWELRTFVASTLILLFASQWVLADTARPNIILVMADDLGWSDVGCYGGEIQTPHIDSLARDGLRFTQFYNNAVCGPTRASLLTGLYCQQIGHRGDHWNQPKDFNKCVTLGEVLQRAGYHTMMVGKWQGRDAAVDRGFHRFFGPMCQAKISYFHEVVQNPYYLNRKRWQLPDDFYMTEAFNEYASSFLREALDQDSPFFLYVAHIAPHWPLHAREKDTARYRAQYRQGWDVLQKNRLRRQQEMGLLPADAALDRTSNSLRDWDGDRHKEWQAERMAVYAAQVEVIDRGLGQLLEQLDQAGKRENTLVLFLSDNGAAPDGGLGPTKSGFGFGPGGQNAKWRLDGVPIRGGSGPDLLPGPHDTFAGYGLAWATLSNTPLRSTKLSGYEGGIRTPLIARWPAVIPQPGAVTSEVGHVIDFMATFTDIARCEYPTTLGERNPLPVEGKSLLPTFRGQRRVGHEKLCWSVPRHHVVRMGSWKAIRPRKGGAWQLFDLESDAFEANDLADRAPQRLQILVQEFETWRERVTATTD